MSVQIALRGNVNDLIRPHWLCAHMVTALAAAGVYEISFNVCASAETILLWLRIVYPYKMSIDRHVYMISVCICVS